MKTIKVAVADDHPIVRNGLKTILDLQEDIEIIGTADNGKSAVELAAEKQPNVMLIDIYMPEMNGLEATKIIKKEFPNVHILLITSQPDDNSVIQAMINGASGFILKEWETDEIVRVIHSVISGQMVLPSLASKKLASSLASQQKKQLLYSEDEITQYVKQQSWGKWEPLFSLREKQILLLLLNNHSNTDIADLLHLSKGTVKNYLSSIYKTLGVTNRRDAKQVMFSERKL